MILLSWLVSSAISLPPVLGWRPVRRPGECILSTDLGIGLRRRLGIASFGSLAILWFCELWHLWSFTVLGFCIFTQLIPRHRFWAHRALLLRNEIVQSVKSKTRNF